MGRCSEYHLHWGCSTKHRQAQLRILGLGMKEESVLPWLLPLCGGQPARDTGVQLIKNRIKPNGIGNRHMKNVLQTTGSPFLLWPWEGSRRKNATSFIYLFYTLLPGPQKGPWKCFTSRSAAGGPEIELFLIILKEISAEHRQHIKNFPETWGSWWKKQKAHIPRESQNTWTQLKHDFSLNNCFQITEPQCSSDGQIPHFHLPQSHRTWASNQGHSKIGSHFMP